jgi:hypothetical protein
MSTNTSPSMGIVVPVVLSEPGPAWATEIYNALFTTIDGHDHTAGKGKLITPPAMNINADLTFASFNATTLRSARFAVQAAPLALGPDIACLYSSPTGTGDLYWNDSSGAQIRLTQNHLPANTPAFTGPVTGTGRTVTTTYTVDSITSDYALFADTTGGAFNMTLPTPTAQRMLRIIDVKGNFQTAALTLVPHGAEKINGLNANKVLTAQWSQWEIISNGTDWFVSGD